MTQPDAGDGDRPARGWRQGDGQRGRRDPGRRDPDIAAEHAGSSSNGGATVLQAPLTRV
ncbi:MAG TPA: hypothetical protein VFI15_00940 [Candidatus Limnocylindrales bacterium]|nr:hypothetical protein [Candidatus Limnocylindrales bacterium]